MGHCPAHLGHLFIVEHLAKLLEQVLGNPFSQLYELPHLFTNRLKGLSVLILLGLPGLGVKLLELPLVLLSPILNGLPMRGPNLLHPLGLLFAEFQTLQHLIKDGFGICTWVLAGGLPPVSSVPFPAFLPFPRQSHGCGQPRHQNCHCRQYNVLFHGCFSLDLWS